MVVENLNVVEVQRLKHKREGVEKIKTVFDLSAGIDYTSIMGNGTNPDTMVENAHLPYDQHGYDYNKRAAVYPFLAKHLGLDLSSAMPPDGTLNEEGIVIEKLEALYTTKRENNKSTQINW